MTCDQKERLLKGVDKAERDLASCFAYTVVDGRLDSEPTPGE